MKKQTLCESCGMRGKESVGKPVKCTGADVLYARVLDICPVVEAALKPAVLEVIPRYTWNPDLSP